jgi:hypothetical protein
MRALVVAGWKLGLGLRLGPVPSDDHVLGWKIASISTDLVILEVKFRFGAAHNIVRVEGPRVVVATFVRHEERGGSTVWAMAAPLHHRIVPYLLGHAAEWRTDGDSALG